jgi:WxL domain surface cell wall-binding
MRFLLDLTSRRTTRLLAASALLIGVGGATMAASSAPAAQCDGVTFAASCDMIGTATISGQSLGMAAPATQTWSVPLDGLDHQLVDATAPDTSFLVQDFTGTGDGWTVSAAATQFVGTLVTPTDTNTLANTGTLVFNGSTTSETTGAIPSNDCAPGTTCTAATTTGLAEPVDIAQDGTGPFTIYGATVGTGMGTIRVGALAGANPAAWWVNVPASAKADVYTSTITLAISSVPLPAT